MYKCSGEDGGGSQTSCADAKAKHASWCRMFCSVGRGIDKGAAMECETETAHKRNRTTAG